MIRAVLIDDDKLALVQLQHVLGQHPDVSVAAVFTDPLQALSEIPGLQPDIVFLDIEMPGVSGLVVAEELLRMDENIAVAFVTGSDGYAIRAFELNAIDYVLKPASYRRLNWTLEKVRKRTGAAAQTKDRIAKADGMLSRTELFDKIFVWEEDRIILLPSTSVLFFTLEGRNVIVRTKQKGYTTGQTLNHWEKRLQGLNFFRCHRSFLVNLDKVEKILPMFGGTYNLKLMDYPSEVPVSRNYAKQLKDTFGF